MAIKITVTSSLLGQAILYQYKDQQGQSALVPAYRATMSLWVPGYGHPTPFWFSVTRDVSEVVFEGRNTDRHGINGECPPSQPGTPYCGVVHAYRGTGFAIRLYEPEVDSNQRCFRGQGSVTRSNILIHQGPGRSLGCMMVVGGPVAFSIFTDAFRQFQQWSTDGAIFVEVEERSPYDLIRVCG